MSDVRPSDGGAGGYRGALPPRSDWLARGWVLVVIAIFLSLFVLALLDVPSRFIPEPTPVPIVTPAPSGSAEPSGSGDPSESAAPSESDSQAASPTP